MAKVAVRGVVSRIEWYRLAVAVVENSVMPRRDRWGAAMQQIADWHKKLGMSEYAERFAEERIEIDVLPALAEQDLERLSIPLGHRRRMLRAIRELAGSPPAPSQTVAATEPTRQDDAERRQLTVMFCDLVGSTVDQARPRG